MIKTINFQLYKNGFVIADVCTYASNTWIYHCDTHCAVIYRDGRKDWQEWWLHGKKLNVKSQSEFEKYMKLKLLW